MLPDFDRAATVAAQALVDSHIEKLPVRPESVIQTLPNTVLVPYRDVARILNVPRDELLVMLDPARDAVTYVMNLSDGRQYYVVAYNQQKSFDRLRFTLAHELGHRLLLHNGSRPEAVREAEADHFALHYCCPRAMVALLTRRGIPPLDINFINLAGLSPYAIGKYAGCAPSHVDKHLNRILREQFIGYLDSLFDYGLIVREPGPAACPVDMGRFMEGYED